MAPLDPNWKKPEVSPEIVSKVKKIEVPDFDNIDYNNLRSYNGSILNFDSNRFGGIYATNLLLNNADELQEISGRLLKTWVKAYGSYIDRPEYHSKRMIDLLTYARTKDIVDTLGPIKVLDSKSHFNVFDSFTCKYVDANEDLSSNIYRFKMLNPIYNKVGNWWLGDKGQPIMAVPNNMDSYDSEPVVPKSYDDYLTYTESQKNLVDKANKLIESNKESGDLTRSDFDILDSAATAVFSSIHDAIPEYTNGIYNNDHPLSEKSSSGHLNHNIVRVLTPLEFMSPYNPDVLVPEDKLNELAKEHPEVWKPMIFEYKGYKSICVSANGYIISAYQPAPNVFLPIHIYGVSDHRGPDGYDAAKSVIITIKALPLSHNSDPSIYNYPNEADIPLIDSNAVELAYNQLK